MSFKRNIVKAYDKEPFWGRYKDLNNASVPSLSAIQEYQLQSITNFQRISERKIRHKYKHLNSLFHSGNVNTLISNDQKETETQLNKAITNIVNAINGTYAGTKTINKQTFYNYELLSKKLLNLKDSIDALNIALKSAGSQGIPARYIEQVNTALQACKLKSLNIAELDSWFKHLNKYKGDLVEDIGVEWLSSLKIPNIMTINTGALNLQGELSKNRHTGQLIQDLMMLDVSSPDVMNTSVTYKPIGSDGMITTTLKQLLSDMEAAAGQTKQIVINNDTYDTLLKLSALNIQAKSGLNQKPWNENASTVVSLGEFAPEDGLTLSAFHTFNLLHQLDQEKKPEAGIWVKNQSPDYNMIADYGLHTVLVKILHLEAQGNQFLLTPDGFTTYTDRIRNLMEKRNSRIYIKGGVTINNNTMGTPYKVSMTNYK